MLKKLLKHRRMRFDRQCDRDYSAYRVVSEELSEHRIYVGLMAVAEKKSARVTGSPPAPTVSAQGPVLTQGPIPTQAGGEPTNA